jgi:hypothetical protein
VLKKPALFAVSVGVMLIGVCSTVCLADTTGATPGPTFKVYDDQHIMLAFGTGKNGVPPDSISRFLIEDITPCLSQDKVSPIYACTKEELNGAAFPTRYYLSPTPADGTITPDHWLYFLLTGPPGWFQGGRLYRLTYWQKASTGKESPTTVNVDTTPLVSVAVQPRGDGQYQLTLSSSLAFTRSGKIVLGTPRDCPVIGAEDATKWKPITFTASPEGGAAKGPGPASINGLIGVPTDYTGQGLPGANFYNQLGTVFVCINARMLSGEFPPNPPGADTALAKIGIQSPLKLPANSGHYLPDSSSFVTYAANGSPGWAFGPGTKISPSTTAPTGKTDANFYANVNMVAATGAKFAWGLDGKVAELQKGIGKSNWTITWLSATANVGNNTSSIKGQTYSDSIDWTLPISHEWDSIGGHPTTLVFVANPDYSTDIEFDRKTLVADGHLVWIPGSLYQTLERKNAEQNNLVNGALWKYPNPKSKTHMGGELDFRGGVEAGGALIATTQKASSGTAKITVPGYNIARFVPQIHGLFQWLPLTSTKLGLLTIDETFTGRYLLATENTVEQYNIPATGSASATVGLLLRPITGWKGYNSLITTWYPPHSANVGLTATFNDGFNAPKFSRVNSVTIGLTIMY